MPEIVNTGNLHPGYVGSPLCSCHPEIRRPIRNPPSPGPEVVLVIHK